MRVRQPAPPALTIEPREGDGGLSASLVAHAARPAHRCPPSRRAPPARSGSPAGTTRRGADVELRVFPDLKTARRLALAVARGRFRDQGATARGPLGLGTEFELIRDYQPDDDIRQVNWRATARLGRPMSNQYRLEQDRDLQLLIDAGRLWPRRWATMNVLDACLDAAAALAFVADELGDRTGAIAFDEEVRAALKPRRAGGQAVVRALFDLQPRPLDSDYEAAFRRAEGSKRALVVVFVDLLEETAARPLVEAVPVLARRHAVVVASPTDPALAALAAARGTDALARARARDRRATSSRARAGAPRRSGPPGRACWRRRPTRCPRRSSPPTCGPRRAPCSDAPRSTRGPEQHEQRRRRASPGPRPAGPARSRSPRGSRTGRATGSCPRRSRPRGSPRGAATSRAAAARAGSAPTRSAARRSPPTTMHEISSGPCEEISRRNAMPLPAPIARPPITPSSSPLKNSA